MGGQIRTNITDFILLGFSDFPLPVQFSLFAFMLSGYLATLVGNGVIILTITIDPLLHTPMYFFLRNLSFLEICFTSVTIPKVLESVLSITRSISFLGCAVQMYVFQTIGVCECVFLMVMAFDRYMAICHPLRYMAVMTPARCYQLTLGSWMIALLLSLGQTIFVFTLPYCGSNLIDHFFCDYPPLLDLACDNTFINRLSVFMACLCGAGIPFILIICSYIKILSSIFLLHSAEAQLKALSTCGSHLASVVLFYGTAMYLYLRLGTQDSEDDDRLITLFYYIVVPALNPLIYSLRNKDMKAALRKFPSKVQNKLKTYV
ncbi:olfactory receptor 10AG1-like [Dendropsophus ebraccatus]|uniref:olfactory receptor 10AG1-like n=1 Tax=Dendropsophus ebraccatus TaxID=150705 RepID=UPI0038318ED9